MNATNFEFTLRSSDFLSAYKTVKHILHPKSLLVGLVYNPAERADRFTLVAKNTYSNSLEIQVTVPFVQSLREPDKAFTMGFNYNSIPALLVHAEIYETIEGVIDITTQDKGMYTLTIKNMEKPLYPHVIAPQTAQQLEALTPIAATAIDRTAWQTTMQKIAFAASRDNVDSLSGFILHPDGSLASLDGHTLYHIPNALPLPSDYPQDRRSIRFDSAKYYFTWLKGLPKGAKVLEVVHANDYQTLIFKSASSTCILRGNVNDGCDVSNFIAGGRSRTLTLDTANVVDFLTKLDKAGKFKETAGVALKQNSNHDVILRHFGITQKVYCPRNGGAVMNIDEHGEQGFFIMGNKTFLPLLKNCKAKVFNVEYSLDTDSWLRVTWEGEKGQYIVMPMRYAPFLACAGQPVREAA